MRDDLLAEKERRGLGDISVIGPAPAFIRRLRGRYRWHIIVRGADPGEFLARLNFGQGWTVDIDPVGIVQ